MSIQFAYYSSRESEQFTFYRIPKALFTDPAFFSLSTDAKLLYGLMLDRIGLSIHSGWVDELDHVYIYYSLTEIMDQMGCGHNKAIRLLKELDQDIGLIRRKRQGLGKPDRIYVMNEGQIVGELDAAEATQESIMECIVGSLNKEAK